LLRVLIHLPRESRDLHELRGAALTMPPPLTDRNYILLGQYI
jgi:hypothetical protein